MPTVRLDKMLEVIGHVEYMVQKLRSSGGAEVHLRNSVATGLWYAINELRDECAQPRRKWPVGSGELEEGPSK